MIVPMISEYLVEQIKKICIGKKVKECVKELKKAYPQIHIKFNDEKFVGYSEECNDYLLYKSYFFGNYIIYLFYGDDDDIVKNVGFNTF